MLGSVGCKSRFASSLPCAWANVLLGSQSKPISSPKPKKVHEKAILWVETNPNDKEEMLTASAGLSHPFFVYSTKSRSMD